MKWRIKDVDEILKKENFDEYKYNLKFTQFKKQFYRDLYLKRTIGPLLGVLMIVSATKYPEIGSMLIFIGSLFLLISFKNCLTDRTKELNYQFAIFKKIDEEGIKKLKNRALGSKKDEKTAWGLSILITTVFFVISYYYNIKEFVIINFFFWTNFILVAQSIYKYFYFDRLSLDRKKFIVSESIMNGYIANRPYGLEQEIGIKK